MNIKTEVKLSNTTKCISPTLLYLNKEDIKKVGGEHSDIYVGAMKNILIKHARKEFVQPLKPYLRTDGNKGHIADRIIAMPAHVGGNDSISGIKWIGSKHDNPGVRGLERASAMIILNDPESNYPIAVMEGSLISSMRTAAVTAVAAEYLAKKGFSKVTCLGCGLIAKKQIQSLLEQFPQIKTIYLYDIHKEAAQHFAKELTKIFPTIEFVVKESAEDAVRLGEVIVTCTVTDKPYIHFEWLQKGTFVSNISIMDLHKETFLHADKVIVDDWEQANREKKIIHQLVTEGQFSKETLYAELGEIILGNKQGRENDEEIIVLNPMGMAIEDIGCAYEIYQRALKNNIGTSLSLY